MQISLLLLTLFGLFAWFYWKFIRLANSSSLPAGLDNVDKCWVLGLSLLYALISFIHFADSRAYTTPWHGMPDAKLVLTLNTPIPLSAFYYSTGYAKGSYSIRAISAADNVISLKDNDSIVRKSLPYFRWNKIKLDGLTAVSSIAVDISKGPIDITQVVLIDHNNRLVSDYTISDNTSQPFKLNTLIATTLPQHMDNIFLSSAIFDEIYYATSAYEYLHGLAPSVWVHPQLGIYLIALGILIFGMSPLGWRIMPNVACIVMVPLMYLFARRLFKQRRTAIVVTLLIMTEFMHFTLGRAASLEPFVTLFLILEYYFLYDYLERRSNGAEFNTTCKSLLYCAFFFGLALSCKWSALYSLPVIAWSLLYGEFVYNRSSFVITRCFNLALLFIIFPLLIYLLTYVPYGLIQQSDNLIGFVYLTQKAMLNFHLHGQLHATHPYASPWWSWPLNQVPLSMYYWQDANGYMSASVALLNNPAVCWLTWPIIVFLSYQWLMNSRNIAAAFLCLAIATQYLSYVFVSRISFIYYFYSVTPFLILGIGYALNQLWERGRKTSSIIAYSYVALNALLFFLFFPVLAGLTLPRHYTLHVLEWMKTWNF